MQIPRKECCPEIVDILLDASRDIQKSTYGRGIIDAQYVLEELLARSAEYEAIINKENRNSATHSVESETLIYDVIYTQALPAIKQANQALWDEFCEQAGISEQDCADVVDARNRLQSLKGKEGDDALSKAYADYNLARDVLQSRIYDVCDQNVQARDVLDASPGVTELGYILAKIGMNYDEIVERAKHRNNVHRIDNHAWSIPSLADMIARSSAEEPDASAKELFARANQLYESPDFLPPTIIDTSTVEYLGIAGQTAPRSYVQPPREEHVPDHQPYTELASQDNNLSVPDTRIMDETERAERISSTERGQEPEAHL